ncbi:hypothetical protein CCR75_007777 [Bremia lactucae]|uniref:PH domain-containing protein n=1 Tax=Bremia lactucae TaxID=4779 RepID=A0A976NZ02_BRELC|nr:hypothetical protein CCR75_007777 [Bremia lactucae]
MGPSASKQRRLYRPFNAGEFTVAWLTFKGDAVEDKEQRHVAKKEGLLSSKLLRGLFGAVIMQSLEEIQGEYISKEAFVCTLALFYEGNTDDRISYIFTMHKIILSGENKTGEGYIDEKDYLFLLNYLGEYLPVPKQLYAAFEECLLPMAGMLSNSKFITWARQYPDVVQFLAIYLPPSPVPESLTSAVRAMPNEGFLETSDLNNSPSCQIEPNRSLYSSSFDFIGGEDSGDEDSDGLYDSDHLTEVEMSQSSYRDGTTLMNGHDELTNTLKEADAVVQGEDIECSGNSSQSGQRVDPLPKLATAQAHHDLTAPSRRALGRSGVSRTHGVQKMGRYMGKAVGGGISRVGHVGRSILHVGKSQGNKQQGEVYQTDDSTAAELLSAGYSFSSESQSTKKYVCGYLHKISDSKWGKKRSWHRRWFVLDRQRGVLSYYRHNPAKHMPTSSSQGNIVHMADSPIPLIKADSSTAPTPVASSGTTGEFNISSGRSRGNLKVEERDTQSAVQSTAATEDLMSREDQVQAQEQQQTLLYLNEAHPWYRGALDLNMRNVSLLFEKTLARNAPTRFFFQVSTLALHDIDLKRGTQYKLCADTETNYNLWTSAIAEVVNRKDSRNGTTISNDSPMLFHQQVHRQQLNHKQTEELVICESDHGGIADSGQDSLSPSKKLKQKSYDISKTSSHPKRKVPPHIVTQFPVILDGGQPDASSWHLCFHIDGIKQCLIVGFMLNIVAIRCLATEHVLWKLLVCIAVSGLFALNTYNPTPRQRLRPGSRGESLVDSTINNARFSTDVAECSNPQFCCLHRLRPAVIDGVDIEKSSASRADDVLQRRSNDYNRRVNKFPMGSSMVHCNEQPTKRLGNGEHSWTTARAETFSVRSSDYKKSRKKEASKAALFEFVGADLVRTESKVDLISQRVEFPAEYANSRLFIINAQLPSYGPSVWGDSSYDGPGYSLALYWKIPDEVVEAMKDPTTTTLTLLKRFLEAGDDTSLTDRFKVIAQVTNQDECGITGMAKKLLTSHNATPVLTRPQHRIYHFENGTTEIVVDIHAFSYIARRGIHAILDKTSRLVIDVAFVLQGETEDELPEQVLGCCRLDHVNVQKAMDLPS